MNLERLSEAADQVIDRMYDEDDVKQEEQGSIGSTREGSSRSS
jgi:hypothetical protein